MKNRLVLYLSLIAVLSMSAAAQPKESAGSKPKLIVAITIDQFRYDYLTRFRSSYTAGFDRLLNSGAVFTNAFFQHFPTQTAVGHATLMTGATPSQAGIVANEWYNRESRKVVTSVTDDTVRLLGSAGERPGCCSPRRLLVSTVGDEMKMAGTGKPRVIGISFKDRSAILTAGHMADAAYWFDSSTGGFVSSTFYFSDLPGWVKEFNGKKPADKYLGAEWKAVDGERVFRQMAKTAGRPFYSSLERTPFANDLVLEFAQRAVDAEELGRDNDTDLLTVSFSANDYVGHDTGPHSPEVRDISIRTDRILGQLFSYLDAKIGLANVLVVLMADHAVAPLPEKMQEFRMPGGRLSDKALRAAIETALTKAYGEGEWISGMSGSTPFFNRELIRQKGLKQSEVENTAAAAVAVLPHIARVYTREQLLNSYIGDGPVARRVLNGFNPQRSGDLLVITEPYWFFSASGTSHGTPYNYDSHVPVIFMGPGVKPGIHHRPITPNDIAPTLATILGIETPSGSSGTVLFDMLH